MNGHAIYTTWTVCASFLNLGITLKYISGLTMKDTSNLCLSLQLILMVVYFLAENTSLDKYIRFIVTPWLGNVNSVFV